MYKGSRLFHPTFSTTGALLRGSPDCISFMGNYFWDFIKLDNTTIKKALVGDVPSKIFHFRSTSDEWTA